jgi:hypothetical protein
MNHERQRGQQKIRASIKRLLAKRKTYFSQAGEDGLLEYILGRLPQTDGWCVEFGAWDGRYLSNTYHLITRRDYNAVLIELDPQRCLQLRENMKSYKAICLNAMVGFEGEKRLDRLLAGTPIPHDFDLLSVDVDGDDYHIWKALVEYAPKVVIIEINFLDGPGVDNVHVPGAPMVWGVTSTSIKSMTELARSKGYSLIAHVGCNAVYVRSEYRALFHATEFDPEDVFTYEGHPLRQLSPAQMLRRGWPLIFAKIRSKFSS